MNSIDKKPLIFSLSIIFSLFTTVIIAMSISVLMKEQNVSFIELLSTYEAGNTPIHWSPLIVGILGIALISSVIIIEFAEGRYTSHLAEQFLASKKSLAMLIYFISSALVSLWISFIFTTSFFNPIIGHTVLLLTVSTSLFMLFPYISHIFTFVSPVSAINRMSSSIFNSVHRSRNETLKKVEQEKALSISQIEQLADIALNAALIKDNSIGIQVIDELGNSLRDYLSNKEYLPQQWFEISDAITENSDFLSMSESSLIQIAKRRYWFEMKVLRQYQRIYSETLNSMRDINYQIAINTRKIAERAIIQGEPNVAPLVVKFFNTFLRAAINGKDVRTAYNVMSQYRKLAEFALFNGQPALAENIAQRIGSYGLLAHMEKTPFILETAAHDLSRLNEIAHGVHFPQKTAFLNILLNLNEGITKSSRDHHGVIKAKLKLGSYYMVKNNVYAAKAVFGVLYHEDHRLLLKIMDELRDITDKEFWEIVDRGENFDYISEERQNSLERFYENVKRGLDNRAFVQNIKSRSNMSLNNVL